MRLAVIALILLAFNVQAENPKLYLKNIPISNKLIIGVDLEAIIAFQEKFGVSEADGQIESFEDYLGIELSQLSSLLIAGSGDLANPKNDSAFLILKSKAPIFAEKVLHSGLKLRAGAKAQETKFNNHPVYIVQIPEVKQDIIEDVEAEEAVEVSFKKDVLLTNLTDDSLVLGGSKSIKEVLSTVKFDKMLSVTSSSQMMKIMDDEPSLFFLAFSFEDFISTTLGQMIALNPASQGVDFESINGMMFNLDYKEDKGLKLSLKFECYSTDARIAFEGKIKQLRNQRKDHIKHGKVLLSGGANVLKITYELKDDELKSMIEYTRDQMNGVSDDTGEELDEEEDLDIPEEIE
ncbi:hypothetical protein PQO03_07080 [Lentisphaera profundi]|uniref:Uncharacterized protein n=1 Tax=Lentisphaera profundi TaxID=1658616 RepID=A0ABY7VN23_9BACT|nr:hypothetical protein [Lentisphaera profundi]WDE95480.1 hypothetical protein PQO03_07080 [Lentisphaera profundi]